MKHTLLLAAYLLCQNIFAQAPEVKNLHYTFEQSSYNRKKELVIEKEGVHFYAGDSILMAERTREDKVWPYYMFYFEKEAAVIIMPNRKDYVVDPLDSTIRYEQKLVPTGNTKEINGYNCEEYTIDVSNNILVTRSDWGKSTTMASKDINYKYKVWITKDISFRADYNPYLISLLRYDHTNTISKFEGVIVKLEGTLTYGEKVWTFANTLEKSKFEQKPTITKLPWLEAKPGKALLRYAIVENSNGTAFKDKELVAISDMQRDFLFKVVGNEDVKFQRSLGVTSYLSTWW